MISPTSLTSNSLPLWFSRAVGGMTSRNVWNVNSPSWTAPSPQTHPLTRSFEQSVLDTSVRSAVSPMTLSGWCHNLLPLQGNYGNVPKWRCCQHQPSSITSSTCGICLGYGRSVVVFFAFRMCLTTVVRLWFQKCFQAFNGQENCLVGV